MSDQKLPIIISIPHSSTFVPADLRRSMLLNDKKIRKASDLYTDQVFDVPAAHVLKAKISRLVVDVNRAPDDIEIQYKLYHDGVVVNVDEFGDQIYKSAPELKEIISRVEKYHTPFHAEIEKYSKNAKFLIDGHSMWSVGPPTRPDAGYQRSEIVVGNRDFTTCSRDTTLKIVKFFENEGFDVYVNDPYPGKYVIAYHCSRKSLPGIQIEINRKLIQNEETLAPKKSGIERMNAVINRLVIFLASEIEKKEASGKLL